MRLVSAALLLALSSAALADPRKVEVAYTLSGVGTGVSGAVFLSSFWVNDRSGDVNMPLLWAGLGSSLITPSLGQWYAGKWFTPGLGIRIAAGAVAAYAILEHSQTERCLDSVEPRECTGLTGDAIPFLGVAAIAWVGGAALDFRDIPQSVAAYNRAHFHIAPMIGPATVGVAGTF